MKSGFWLIKLSLATCLLVACSAATVDRSNPTTDSSATPVNSVESTYSPDLVGPQNSSTQRSQSKALTTISDLQSLAKRIVLLNFPNAVVTDEPVRGSMNVPLPDLIYRVMNEYETGEGKSFNFVEFRIYKDPNKAKIALRENTALPKDSITYNDPGVTVEYSKVETPDLGEESLSFNILTAFSDQDRASALKGVHLQFTRCGAFIFMGGSGSVESLLGFAKQLDSELTKQIC